MSNSHIFTVGGTVQASNGLYIPRRADDELLALCRGGHFAYVLTPRQLGKSSLMVRTAEQLTTEGVRSVIIDLSQIGVQVTAEEWYLGLLSMLEEQLDLDTDVVQWWRERAHLGVTQRLTMFFEEVLLKEVNAPVVVFVDEIDTTLSLNFTDDFFAAIRYFYNARALSKDVRRLSFVLIGVATPGDLIRDPQRTPFNIGQRVDLTDFTLEEALPLAAGFALADREARQVLGWVMKWTGGHPYLTQRLCRALTDDGKKNWSEADIDAMVGETFFGRISEEDNNLQFVRDMLTKRAPNLSEVLYTYREVLNHKRRVQDEEQSRVKSHLKLSGVAQRRHGELSVRNPIYARVFNEAWVKQHLPVNWTKRLTRVAIGLVLTLMILSVPTSLWAIVAQRRAVAERDEANRQKQIAEMQSEVANDERAKAVKASQDTERQRQLAVAAAAQERLARQSEGEQRQKAEEAARKAEALAKSESKAREKALELGHLAEAAKIEAEKSAALARVAEHEAQRLRKAAEEQSQTNAQERDVARGQHQVSVARQLADQGGQRLLAGNPFEAELYLAKAMTLDDRTALRNAFLEAGAKSARTIWQKPTFNLGVETATVNFSPDKRSLAVAIADGSISLIDTDTGKEIRTLAQREKPENLIYSPDGRQLAVQSLQGINVWDTETGKLLGRLNPFPRLVAFYPDLKRLIAVSDREPEKIVTMDIQTGQATEIGTGYHVTFSKDGKLAFSRLDGSITIVSVETGKALTLRADFKISDLTFIMNGKRLAAVSEDQLRIWDITSAQMVEGVLLNKVSNRKLAVSPDGKSFAAIDDNQLRIWDTATGAEKETQTHRIDGLNTARNIALGPGGRLFAAMWSDGTAGIWDVETGELSATVYHDDLRQDPLLEFDLDGTRLYSLHDHKIKAWDINLGRAGTLLSGHTGAVTSVAFSPDGGLLASGGMDKTIKTWNIETGKQVGNLNRNGEVIELLNFDPQRQRLGSFESLTETAYKLLDTKTGAEIVSSSDVPFLSVRAVSSRSRLLSPNGRFLATQETRGQITLRNLETGKLLNIDSAGTSSVDELAFSRDSREFAQGDHDGSVRIWDVETGGLIVSLRGHNSIEGIYFSPDNKRIALISIDAAEIWDIANKRLVSKISRITGPIEDGCFSPDGRLFAGIVSNRRIKLWDAETGSLVRTLSADTSVISAIFSPDGKWLVSRGSGLRLWDLETKNPEMGSILPGSGGSNAAFSPDGRWLAYGDKDGRVRLWDFAAVKHVYTADHWTLLRETTSEISRRVVGLDFDFIPQLRVRDILGNKYNPSYDVISLREDQIIQYDEKDKQSELKENNLRNQPPQRGSISGTISFDGEPPPPKRIDFSADPSCGAANTTLFTEDSIVTNGKLANVFVYVKSGSRLDYYSFDTPTSEVVLERKGCQSIPHLIGTQTHQVLTFLNGDRTTHNYHIIPKLNQEWNVSLPAGTTPLYKEFDRPEIIPLKCNQHPWERSYIGVFSNPFFAITRKDGSYTLPGLPPGRYTIVAWHEKYGERGIEVTIGPDESKTIDFTFIANPGNSDHE